MSAKVANSDMGNNASAVDDLVTHIKMMIHSGEVGVGDGLPSERELGERFGASRNTVREAIRTLKAYGLVDVRPKTGAVLVDNQMAAALEMFSFNLRIDRETFRDVQGFRRLVEVGIVDRLFSHVSDEDLVNLGRINRQMHLAQNVPEIAQYDYRFHVDLLKIAQNDTVTKVYEIMQPIILKLMEIGKERRGGVEGKDETYQTHATILSCVRERDRLGFQYWMNHHLGEGLKYIIAPEEDYQS